MKQAEKQLGGAVDDDSGDGLPIPHVLPPAAAAPDPGAAATDKFLSVIKAIDKSVKFETEIAAGFIEKNDYVGLEAYVLEKLAFVQGPDQQHPHPGILCCIYKAQITYLVREDNSVDAERVLNEKLKPLLDNVDKYYSPRNLEEQVRQAEKCISSVGLHEDTHTLSHLLEDYFGLYFPSALMPDIERKASVFDFVGKRDRGGVEETRCLACQWVLPKGTSEARLIKHYVGNPKVKHCFHVTEWMISYLKTIKTVEGAGLVSNPFGKSVPEATGKPPEKTREKRKRPQLSGGNMIVTEPLMDSIVDLHSAICKIPYHLNEEEQVAKDAATEVRKVLSDVHIVTNDLLCWTFRSANAFEPLDPLLAISKLTDLSKSAQKLLMPMFSLRQSKSMVQSLYRKVKEVEKISSFAEVTGLKKGNAAGSDVSGEVSIARGGTSTDTTTTGNTGSAATPI